MTTAVLGVLSTGVLAAEVPVATAVLVMVPASTSACVGVYVAEHVVLSPTARAVAAQVTAPIVPVPLNAVSSIPMSEIATLPVFETAKVYVTGWPAAVIVVGVAVLVSSRTGAAAVIVRA